MMTFNKYLYEMCSKKNNRLCIGLDLDNRKLKINTISYMNGFIKELIESTIDLCPVYKINLAFYERLGKEGYDILSKIPEYIDKRAVTIADAKRGDIGNSSKYYAEAIFKTLNYDSITISPYMGEDSIQPFCEYNNKGVFILCLTSNPGSSNFQNKKINNKELYIHVSELAVKMNINNNIGLVVGATKNDQMNMIKDSSSDLPWLIPGVGFQGGSLKDSILIGGKNNAVPIINVSRGIIYSGDGTINDIREATEEYTKKIQNIL
tara:strand:- start:42471 stop:43262 length:792 start_codon:yes stop_codon:yes gene_type:complete